MKPMKLFALLASNAKRGTFRAEGNTIYVYDVIVGSDAEAEFWGGVSPEAFAKTLKGIKGDVSIRINSPGGDVFAGRAIAAAIAAHDGTVTTYVDGYAASAASIVAVSGERVVMAEGAMMMIHKAWTFALGNADDLIATADLLEKIDATLADTYAAKSGGKAEDFAAMMAKETWFTAEEAVNAGLASEIAKPAEKAKSQNAWNLSAFDNAPKVEPEPARTASNEHEHRARVHAARMLSQAA